MPTSECAWRRLSEAALFRSVIFYYLEEKETISIVTKDERSVFVPGTGGASSCIYSRSGINSLFLLLLTSITVLRYGRAANYLIPLSVSTLFSPLKPLMYRHP